MSILIRATVFSLLAATASAQSAADLSRLTVLEDRTKPNGRKIELAYAVLK
jgi:hypothetical protein